MDRGEEEAALVRLEDRRSVLAPAETIVLGPNGLEVRRPAGTVVVPLGAIRRVRIALELAGGARQAVCRVNGAGREVVFGSQRATGPGRWVDNGEAFRRLVVALHEALRPRFDEVEFVRGQSRAFRWAMFVLGLVLTAVAVAVVVTLAVRGEGLAMVLGTMPLVLIGMALAAGFRPGHPPHYDPETLIEEFSDPVRADDAGEAAAPRP